MCYFQVLFIEWLIRDHNHSVTVGQTDGQTYASKYIISLALQSAVDKNKYFDYKLWPFQSNIRNYFRQVKLEEKQSNL